MSKAGFWRRFGASFIDTLISFGIFSIVYETILVSQWGGHTVGKKIMGIRVVASDGKKLDWVKAFVRVMGKYLLAMVLFLGYLWMLWDDESQTWHDKIADTFVVED